MATTYTADQALPSAAVYAGGAGEACVAQSRFTLTAALALGDVIRMVRLPKGAIVLDALLAADDLDSAAAPTLALDVGDDDANARYIAATTVAQAGGIARASVASGVGFTLSADDTVDIRVHTAPATGTVGGLTLVVTYKTP